MKTSASLFLILLSASPAFAAAKHGRKAPETGNLPPKWSALIQPAAVTEVPSGLITSEMGGRDIQFLTSAIEAGRSQIWLCNVAKAKGAADRVQSIGNGLATTQEWENTQLSKLAAKKGLSLPPTGAPSNEKALAAEIGKLSGPDFDKVVLARIVSYAQGTVASYDAASHSEDPAIRDTADRLLPIARDKLLIASPPPFRTGAQVLLPPATAPAPAAAPLPVVARAPAASGTAVPPARPDGPRPVPASQLAPAAPPAIAAPPAAPAAAKPLK